MRGSVMKCISFIPWTTIVLMKWNVLFSPQLSNCNSFVMQLIPQTPNFNVQLVIHSDELLNLLKIFFLILPLDLTSLYKLQRSFEFNLLRLGWDRRFLRNLYRDHLHLAIRFRFAQSVSQRETLNSILFLGLHPTLSPIVLFFETVEWNITHNQQKNEQRNLIFCFFELFMCEHPRKHFNLASSFQFGNHKRAQFVCAKLKHMIHPKVLFKQLKGRHDLFT